MKKIIGVLAIALVATGLFAKTWTNNVGVGFALPINGFQVDISNSKDLSPQISYDIQGMYLGYHENGFTVRGSFDLGVGTVKDFWYDTVKKEYEYGIGVDLREQIGVGYSFIRSEKFVLALTAGIGLKETIIPRTEKVLNTTTDTTGTIFLFDLGGDLTALVRFSERFGMFFNMHAGFVPFGKFYTSSETKTGSTTTTTDKDYNLKTTYIIAPSLGFAWSF